MIESVDELKPLQRSQLYWFFSDLFSQQPQHEHLEMLRSLLTGESNLLERNGLNLLDEINAALENDASMEALQKDYIMLIAGVQEHYGAPPPTG